MTSDEVEQIKSEKIFVGYKVNSYPAVKALARIGKPSLNPLIETIRYTDENLVKVQNAIRVIDHIFYNDSKGRESFLEQALSEAGSPLEAKRIKRLLRPTK